MHLTSTIKLVKNAMHLQEYTTLDKRGVLKEGLSPGIMNNILLNHDKTVP